jgi:hypothetical protein
MKRYEQFEFAALQRQGDGRAFPCRTGICHGIVTLTTAASGGSSCTAGEPGAVVR